MDAFSHACHLRNIWEHFGSLVFRFKSLFSPCQRLKPPVCVCAAELLGSVSTQHHHRGAEGAERHRGPPAGSGRRRHPTRHRLAATERGPQEVGSTALETGGKRDFTLLFIYPFIIKMFIFSVYYLTMNVSRYVLLQVYVAAGSVYGLEAELSDLEECARGICSSTSDMKLSFLEEQVAATAARVQQSELQVTRAGPITHFLDRFSSVGSQGGGLWPTSIWTRL